MTSRTLFCLAMLMCAPSVMAGVYKWTDAQGRVHYSDSPPPEAKSKQVKIKINSIQGPAIVSSVKTPSAVKAGSKVRIYTTTWCGYCKRAKARLTAKGIPHEDLDVETSERGRLEYEALGGRGVPVILVGTQRMDGYDADRLDAMLIDAGW
jgi:glutaredoxin